MAKQILRLKLAQNLVSVGIHPPMGSYSRFYATKKTTTAGQAPPLLNGISSETPEAPPSHNAASTNSISAVGKNTEKCHSAIMDLVNPETGVFPILKNLGGKIDYRCADVTKKLTPKIKELDNKMDLQFRGMEDRLTIEIGKVATTCSSDMKGLRETMATYYRGQK